MARRTILTLALLISTSIFVKSQNIIKPEKFLGHSTQLFAADLFVKLGRGNQLFSPVLIQSGLFLLPAQGEAKNQLIKSLHLTDVHTWANAYIKFYRQCIVAKDVQIKAGSAMYVTDHVRIPNYYEKLLPLFGTKVKTADFTKPEAIAKEVNQWVKDKTNNKITDIVDASTLQSSTEALLVTALYFNGNWEKEFPVETTFQTTFYSNGVSKSTVDMMANTATFNYAENAELDAKFLQLPYKNNDYKMTIVLPNKKEGLPQLEQQITKIFEKQNYAEHDTIVTLPKFKFGNKVQLTEILKKLGLTEIFEDGIAFGTWRAQKLKVDDIIQKTYVDVNEVGTEAAAVMEVEMSARFGITEMKTFKADHPFLFFIQQESSGVVLFLGRFTNPE